MALWDNEDGSLEVKKALGNEKQEEEVMPNKRIFDNETRPKRVNGEKFRENWDRIFSKKKMKLKKFKTAMMENNTFEFVDKEER